MHIYAYQFSFIHCHSISFLSFSLHFFFFFSFFSLLLCCGCFLLHCVDICIYMYIYIYIFVWFGLVWIHLFVLVWFVLPTSSSSWIEHIAIVRNLIVWRVRTIAYRNTNSCLSNVGLFGVAVCFCIWVQYLPQVLSSCLDWLSSARNISIVVTMMYPPFPLLLLHGILFLADALPSRMFLVIYHLVAVVLIMIVCCCSCCSCCCSSC